MGTAGILLNLDPDMNYAQHGAVFCLPFVSLSFMLATLSVSVVWIIDVQKASAMRTGTSSATAKKQERVYLAGLYMFSLSAATLVLILYFRSDAERNVLLSLISVLYCACVGFSYLYAGQRVLTHLHVPDVSCASKIHARNSPLPSPNIFIQTI
jgi:hypothetical protein